MRLRADKQEVTELLENLPENCSFGGHNTILYFVVNVYSSLDAEPYNVENHKLYSNGLAINSDHLGLMVNDFIKVSG